MSSKILNVDRTSLVCFLSMSVNPKFSAAQLASETKTFRAAIRVIAGPLLNDSNYVVVSDRDHKPYLSRDMRS